MNKPAFRVFAINQATCESDYCGVETTTKNANQGTHFLRIHAAESTNSTPNMVTVRIRDLLPALQNGVANKLSWVRDFEDDPVAITQDLYEVLIAWQQMRRAA